MKNIMILLALSSWVFAEFSRSDSGVVTDSVTGLQWQDNYRDNDNNITLASWEDAINYCENLSLDGGKWRLPNIRELDSILDVGRIDTIATPLTSPVFQNGTFNPYWSSTTSEHSHTAAWFIHFGTGNSSSDFSKASTFYVRCVRSKE